VVQTHLAATLRLSQRRTKASLGVNLPLNRGRSDAALV